MSKAPKTWSVKQLLSGFGNNLKNYSCGCPLYSICASKSQHIPPKNPQISSSSLLTNSTPWPGIFQKITFLLGEGELDKNTCFFLWVVGLPSVPLVSDAKNFGEGFPHGESYPSETRYAWKSQYLNPGGAAAPLVPGCGGWDGRDGPWKMMVWEVLSCWDRSFAGSNFAPTLQQQTFICAGV